MRLSPAAELAVRGVVALVERHGRGPTTLKTICAARDLPKQYLVKLFSLLGRADIVTAIRGKRGGYELSRDPKDITLLEVIEAVEGPIVLNFCQHAPPKCDQEDCPMREMWARLQQAIRRELGAMTMDKCVPPSARAE
jgi:Rrf2 family protein